MRNSVLRLCLTFAVVMGLANQANASVTLDYGDDYYVGRVRPGAPANADSEVGYINHLTTLAAGSGDSSFDGQTYNRLDSDLAGPFDPAVTTGGFTKQASELTVDGDRLILDLGTSTAQYIYAKDGAPYGALVWYSEAGFTGLISLPADLNGDEHAGGLSHVSVYNIGENGGTEVPEPASLAIWGALSLAGAGFGYRRKTAVQG